MRGTQWAIKKPQGIDKCGKCCIYKEDRQAQSISAEATDMARCPECNNVVPLPSELTLYDQVYCGECGALLEVVGLSPPELE